MDDVKNKLEEIKRGLDNYCKTVDVDLKKESLLTLQAKTTDPEFWNDKLSAAKLMQEIGDLKEELGKVEKIKELAEEVQMALELEITDEAKEKILEVEGILAELRMESFLSGPHDKKNALFSIHAGQGGTEAMDWVSMLFRMYMKYFEKKKYKTEVLDENKGEEAGYKNISIKVDGKFAYGYLKNESGTHRLVRQSPFNADKKRETSFALVEVLPELDELDLPDIKVNEDDCEWQFFRASSQGGQNVQKVSSAVRLKHIPSGIVVTAQTERFQEQNRKFALELLRARLWVLEQKKQEERVEKIKGEYRPASWGTQIRSYVLHPYKMIKDLRTGVETSDAESVMGGNLDEFVEAELGL